MGITVSGTVYMGSNVFSLGNVVAFSRAEIYKKLLDGFDLPALKEKFPTRIEISDTMASFVGPVAIIKSPALVKTAFIALAGIAAAAVTYYITRPKSDEPKPAVVTLAPKREKSYTFSYVASLVLGAAAAYYANSYATSRFPTQPGIYFW